MHSDFSGIGTCRVQGGSWTRWSAVTFFKDGNTGAVGFAGACGCYRSKRSGDLVKQDNSWFSDSDTRRSPRFCVGTAWMLPWLRAAQIENTGPHIVFSETLRSPASAVRTGGRLGLRKSNKRVHISAVVFRHPWGRPLCPGGGCPPCTKMGPAQSEVGCTSGGRSKLHSWSGAANDPAALPTCYSCSPPDTGVC